MEERGRERERAGERAPLWQNQVFFQHDPVMVNIMITATHM